MSNLKYLSSELESLADTIENLIVNKQYISSENNLENKEPLTRNNTLWNLRKGGTLRLLIVEELYKIEASIRFSDEYRIAEKLAIEKDKTISLLSQKWHEERITAIYEEYIQLRNTKEPTPSKKDFIKRLKELKIYYTVQVSDLLETITPDKPLSDFL